MPDQVSPPINVTLASGIRYAIRFGPLDDLPAAMQELGLRVGRCVLVSDQHVAPLHGIRLTKALELAGWTPHLVEVPAGEESKSLRHLASIYDRVLHWKVDRSTPLVALGGGVVGDLAGFAAATLLRGLPLIHVPTTLLAQVDSSIGGKTGVNHPTGKNLVGAFYQPKLVWCDVETLGTLPQREWTGGAAEIVKHALIDGGPLLALLESGLDSFLHGDRSSVEPVIREAIKVKVGVVQMDEHEGGIRAHLNFGHTFAHALERTLGYGTVTHGEAVAIGMRAALHLSRSLNQAIPFDRMVALVDALPLPALPDDLQIEQLIAAMDTDKKALDDVVRFVLLGDVGEPDVVSGVNPESVRAAWKFALGRRG